MAHIVKLPYCHVAKTLVRDNNYKAYTLYHLRAIFVVSPYPVRTISLLIDTDRVRTRYGSGSFLMKGINEKNRYKAVFCF